MTTTPRKPTIPAKGKSDAMLGRDTARLIFNSKDDDALDIQDPFTREFADAAIREFSTLYKKIPGKLQSVVEGARRAATAQNVDQFHGITEMVQNADDQGANYVSIAVRDSHLLFAHNGRRVEVGDVLPISLPFLTTKASKTLALGRFGIGLKTLDRLGNHLDVHSHPYHFSVRGAEGISLIKPAAAIPGLYDPTQEQTLFDLRLYDNVDLAALSQWLEAWDASSLIFLQHIRAFRIIEPESGALLHEHRLIVSDPKHFDAKENGQEYQVEEVHLQAHNDKRSRSWSRYTVVVSTKAGIQPEHKAVGKTTPLSIAIPNRYGTQRIYIGLPSQLETWFPFNLNAQFEPTTNREGLSDTKWNRWLIAQFQHLLTPLMLHLFLTDPPQAWTAIPLPTEAENQDGEWLRAPLHSLNERVFADLRARARLIIDNLLVPLSGLVFECEELDGLLSIEDQRSLRPGLKPVPLEMRDHAGRWRIVLYDMETSSELTIQDALGILGWDAAKLGSRQISWCVSLAALAINNQLGSELAKYPCVVTSERHLTKVGNANDYILVKKAGGNDLAGRLNLIKVIHPDYLAEDAQATTVRTWLERSNYLTEVATPQQTLTALAARATKQKMELDEDALRMLRDMFSNRDVHAEWYGTEIGKVILVDGYQWQDGKRVHQKVHPAEAYQSQTIDRSPQSWAHAAAETPGILWLDARYRESLSGERGHLLSPTRFFSLLGAQTTPRLQPSPATTSLRNEVGYSLSGRSPANQPPRTQKADLERLPREADTLLQDHQSPALAAVIRDISSMPVSEARQRRARALLATLNRSWDEHYARHTRAIAAYSYRVFHRIKDVPATWIADAASIPWMSNYKGESKAPHQLVQTTSDNILVYYHHQEKWAAEISPEDNLSEVMLRALWIEVDPRTYRVVEELEKLRETTQSGGAIDGEQPSRLYEILARRIPYSYTMSVGGMKSDELKARFGSSPEKPGLVFADNGWHSYKSVFLPPRIFQNRRPFVADDPTIRALWDFLGIRSPSPQDCIKILQELTAKSPTQVEHSIILDTYQHLEKSLYYLPPALKAQISSMPLWTTNGWKKTRPIYAIDAPSLRKELAKHLTMWEVELPSAFPKLASALRITILKPEEFRQISTPRAVQASQDLADRFALAVQHFADRLATLNAELYHSCLIPWPLLQTAQVWLMPELKLEAQIPKQGLITINEALAHMEPGQFSPTFYFRNNEAVGDPQAGGAVIKSLFPSGPSASSLDAEWFMAWNKALVEDQPRGIQLADRHKIPVAERQPLSIPTPPPPKAQDQRQGPSEAKSVLTPAEPLQTPQTRSQLPGRQLKSFREITLIFEGKSGNNTDPAQLKRRRRRGISDAASSSHPDGVRVPALGHVLYSEEEREDAGVELLALVLDQKFGRKLHDYRKQAHVGADLIDDQGHYYELKVHGLEMPNDISLQDNQLERAWQQKDNYTLVVISGVERGAITKLKFFQNPLQLLDWKTGTSKISLTGVLSKQGDLFLVEDPTDITDL